MVKSGVFKLVISLVVGRKVEDSDTPTNVKNIFKECNTRCEIARITYEVLQLQKAYLEQRIISTKWEEDALHVAAGVIRL